MKIRTIIAATCAAIAFSMTGPLYAHDNEAQTVNDGETRIYRAGESWSEPPAAIHSISRNASKTEPAKLLAVFVLDTNDNPLTTPVK